MTRAFVCAALLLITATPVATPALAQSETVIEVPSRGIDGQVVAAVTEWIRAQKLP